MRSCQRWNYETWSNLIASVCKLIEEITITPKNAALTMARTWGGMYDSSIFCNLAVLRVGDEGCKSFALEEWIDIHVH